MKNLLILGTALVVATSAVAQAPLSLPPGLEKNGYGGSGLGHSTAVGSDPDARVQIVNGDQQGSNIIQTWNSISFRRSGSSTNSNPQHDWSNVTISIGDSDFAQASTTFSTNFVSAPTQVFTGAVTFPSIPGGRLNPAWGNFSATDDMKFNFTTPYFSLGAWGTTVDLDFTGANFSSSAYTIDGIESTSGDSYNEAVAYWYGNPGQCYATGFSMNGYVEPIARSYGPNYKDPNSGSTADADKTTIAFNGINLPVSSPIITFFQLGGWRSAAQTHPFNLCQGLSIKLSDPYLLFFFTSDAAGSVNTQNNPIRVNYDKSYVSTRMWTQAAYDNGPNQLDVSMAISHWIAVQPPETKHRCFYRTGATGPTGTEVTQNLPIVLFN